MCVCACGRVRKRAVLGVVTATAAKRKDGELHTFLQVLEARTVQDAWLSLPLCSGCRFAGEGSLKHMQRMESEAGESQSREKLVLVEEGSCEEGVNKTCEDSVCACVSVLTRLVSHLGSW